MKTTHAQINRILHEMPPITLDEMHQIRLMKRTDSKYVTNVTTLLRLLRLAQGHYYAQQNEGSFISPYATTYWDLKDGPTMFSLHQAGHLPRTKVRVRTYVSSAQSFLEVKKKDNHGKTSKKRVSVPSVDAVMNDHAGEDFLHHRTGLTINMLQPTVGNSFSRITLVNYEKTERLTIDFGLHFHNYQTDCDKDMDDAVIIELKRDGRAPSPILPLLRTLRIKPSGFSKYCIGSVVTNEGLRVNRFKKRLIKIGKAVARA